MKKYCYCNGKIIPLTSAGLPLNDLGILRAFGVFDFLKTVNGKPFLWAEHWQRFQNSAQSLGLAVPMSERQVQKTIRDLLKKNKADDASIRLLLTGGPTPDGMTIVTPSFCILIENLYVCPPRIFTHGAKVITHEHLRIVTGAKTTNYLTAVNLQDVKKRAGALEILYLYRGRVLECSTSNFFIVKNNILITPKDDILIGTIRNLVIKLAKAAKIKVEERDVSVAELKTADEAFLTATNKDITPVVRIDNHKVGNGQVGETTKKLMALLRTYMAGY